MTTISVVETRKNLAATIKRVSQGGERIVITRCGKPAVALVSTEDLALLQKLKDAKDVRAVAKKRK